MKQLAKIIINLKEKSSVGKSMTAIPEKYTIENLLNVIDDNLDSHLNNNKINHTNRFTAQNQYPVQTKFSQSQDKDMMNFLMNNTAPEPKSTN